MKRQNQKKILPLTLQLLKHKSMNNFYRFLKIFLFWLGIALCLWAMGANLPWLNELNDPGKFHQWNTGGDIGTSIRNVLIQIFKSLAIVVFVIATILIFVSVIRLLVSDNGEEDFAKWMNTLVWSIAGLFVISIAYTVIRQFETRVLSEESFNGQTIYDMTINIVIKIWSLFVLLVLVIRCNYIKYTIYN